jgi:DNA-binding response OmpR family regulator
MAGVPIGLRALVVEDDPHISQLLREILTMQGYDVTEVADGAEAVPAVRELRPDVVMLDLGLPNVDGLVVLDRIKGDHEIAHTPVVVVTAWWTPELEARARFIGASAVLGKPFDISRIGTVVAAARAGEPARIVNH